MASPNSLPPVHRLITSHNAAGQAIFEPSIPANAEWEPKPPTDPSAAFFLAYTTSGFPIDVNPAKEGGRPQDIEEYEKKLNAPPKEFSHDNGMSRDAFSRFFL